MARKNNPLCLLHRKIGGPQGQYELYAEDKIYRFCMELNSPSSIVQGEAYLLYKLWHIPTPFIRPFWTYSVVTHGSKNLSLCAIKRVRLIKDETLVGKDLFMHYTVYDILQTTRHKIERNRTRAEIQHIDKLILLTHVEIGPEDFSTCYNINQHKFHWYFNGEILKINFVKYK
jgi:hypothetical protein